MLGLDLLGAILGLRFIFLVRLPADAISKRWQPQGKPKLILNFIKNLFFSTFLLIAV